MSPAEAREIAAEVLRFMAGFPSLRLTKEEAARLAAAFVAKLQDLPLWAIRRALEKWGEVEGTNPSFPPSASDLKVQGDRFARSVREEIGAIETVLKAEVEHIPTDDERAAALGRWYDVIRPTMQHADVSRSNETDRAEQVRANQRILEREIGPCSANERHRMTHDLRRKLQEMNQEHPGDPRPPDPQAQAQPRCRA